MRAARPRGKSIQKRTRQVPARTPRVEIGPHCWPWCRVAHSIGRTRHVLHGASHQLLLIITEKEFAIRAQLQLFLVRGHGGEIELARRHLCRVVCRIYKGVTAAALVIDDLTPGIDIRHARSEEHTSELQSLAYLVCRLL